MRFEKKGSKVKKKKIEEIYQEKKFIFDVKQNNKFWLLKLLLLQFIKFFHLDI